MTILRPCTRALLALLAVAAVGCDVVGDLATPTVRFTAPAPGENVVRTTTVSARAEDNRKLSSLRVLLGDSVILNADSGYVTGECRFYAVGVQHLTAEARDRGGNWARAELDVNVIEAIGRGGLFLSSAPSGADVSLDGRPTGQRTPCMLPAVEEGNRHLKLSCYGHYDRDTTVSVTPGTVSEVSCRLDGFGWLNIATDPPGATIVNDSVPPGSTAPFVARLKAGDQRIVLHLDGCADVDTTATVEAAAMSTLYVILRPGGRR
jgi:hypothetical protein